jgi:hypothetical protein
VADLDDDQRPTAEEDAEWDRKMTAEDPRYPARKAAAEALDKHVSEWIEGYELDDGEVNHTPTELERFLIYDAFAGLTGDEEYMRLHAAWRALCGSNKAFTPAQMLHLEVLRVIEDVARGDPALDTPAGAMLQRLAEAVEEYEKAVFPRSSTDGVLASGKTSDGGLKP